MIVLPLLLTVCCGSSSAPGLEIRPGADPTRIELIADLPERLLTQERGERWLRLMLVDSGTAREGPPILGSYARRDAKLVFVPRFPLTHGQCYRAYFEPVKGELLVREYRVPSLVKVPPAEVERVYPSAAVLPANHLKFYIHFSRPMREGPEVFERIQLVDNEGKPIDDAWRRTELWSGDRKRLTLWIHPGRIKTGVSLREQLGPVLHPDREYSLVIGADLLDGDGRPLARAHIKKFRTTAAARTRPLPEEWKLHAPPVQTTRPLVLEFPQPLDRALLDRFITIVDGEGTAVAGRIEVGSEERSWVFQPVRPWQDAVYTVQVDGEIEDLAGNTPLRLFDVDLSQPAPKPPRLTLEFRPRR